MSDVAEIIAARHEGLLRLVIDRPARRNALTLDLVRALVREIEAATTRSGERPRFQGS